MAQTVANGVGTGLPLGQKLTANIYQEDDDYVAECVELDTVGQGDTIEEAIRDLTEATLIYVQRNPQASTTASQPRQSYIEGVRELEQAYSELIGEPVEPSVIQYVKTITLALPATYA